MNHLIYRWTFSRADLARLCIGSVILVLYKILVNKGSPCSLRTNVQYFSAKLKENSLLNNNHHEKKSKNSYGEPSLNSS